ncbi:MAG: hypothetical protein ACUVS8_13000 [Armatimonadota bacterium]
MSGFLTAPKRAVALIAALVLLGAGSARALPIYFTSFEGDVPFVGGPEWRLPPRHPWAQNSNDPMARRTIGDNDPNLFNPVRTRTGIRSAYQHETFSQWSAMQEWGMDLYDNFYVRAWVWFDRERERLTNVQTPCFDNVDRFIQSGVVTAADDGGTPIPGWPACRISKPGITDSNTYFHMSTEPIAYIRITSGDAAGKEWFIRRPTFYTCGGPPYGYNPFWNINQTLEVEPKAPNTQNPVAAGVKPGDTYEIYGAIAPLYRAVQMWVENRQLRDFAKFGIWHRFGGEATAATGPQCSDTNNWKYFTRQGDNGVNGYYDTPWVDTGIHRGYDFTGWHSLEIRVYGDNPNPFKHQQFHFLVDGQIVGTAPRYTAEGRIPFNRLQIGGLAVSQEWAFWDDIEVGLLPEAGTQVVTVNSIGDARSLPKGTWVQLPQSVVNRVGPGWFQIQAPDRSAGIRCLHNVPDAGPGTRIAKGDVIIPVGRIDVVNGCEKVLSVLAPQLVARGAAVPEGQELFANARDLRADSPSLKGLFVATAGWIVNTGDNSTYLYISDGSSHENEPGGQDPWCYTRVKVRADGLAFTGFEYLKVRGVLGCEDGEPVIYVSNLDQDVEVLSDFELWPWWKDCQ